MNGSLVPANTKKSLLVFGMFRPLPDLLILSGGVGLTVVLLLIRKRQYLDTYWVLYTNAISCSIGSTHTKLS